MPRMVRALTHSACKRSMHRILFAALLCLTVEAATAAAVIPRTSSSTSGSSAACSAYNSSFSYQKTSYKCRFENFCYEAVLCCPEANTTDMNHCIDATHYSCAESDVCPASSTTAVYPRTFTGGATVTCCMDAKAASSSVEAAAEARLTSERYPHSIYTCNESSHEACLINFQPAPLVRALCNNSLPTLFTDDYINSNANGICCDRYESDAPSVKTHSGCGSDVLDLPETGLFHCAIQARGTTACCNGEIYDRGATASSSTTNQVESDADNRYYNYTGSQCLYSGPSPIDGIAAAERSIAHVAVTAAVALALLLLFEV